MQIHASSPSASKGFSRRLRVLGGLLLVFAVVLPRSAGLFHGLDGGGSFHPDTTKQVQAVQNFMEGTYVWTAGSLAYDGYAYGLNHLDEWIVRALRPALGTLLSFMDPHYVQEAPTRWELFWWCRALRLVYGIFCAGLLYGAAKRLGLSPANRFICLLLFACAPLSSTVTHFASGDIGTDLFTALTLWFLSDLRQGLPRRAYLGMGFAVGSAFACKYNGFLVNGLPLACLLLLPHPWAERLKHVGLLLLGNLLGFLWLTPHVFQLPKRTLELIGLNFGYIATYGAPEGFYDQPLFERVTGSLQQNIPLILQSIGWPLSILCMLGLLSFTKRLLAERRGPDPRVILGFSLLAFSVAALLISLAGKPAVQPFHFSYLLLPFALGFSVYLEQLNPGGPRRILFFFAILAAGQGALKQNREAFFWQREDMHGVALRHYAELLEPIEHDRTSPKTQLVDLKVEGPNDAVFRNKPRRVMVPHADAWIQNPAPELPQVHWPLSEDWLFPECLMLPREPRAIWLQPQATVTRHLVRNEDRSPRQMILFQCGQRAARVELQLPGQETRSFHLRAFDEFLHTIPLDVPGTTPITLASEGGMVWCRFPASLEQLQSMRVTMGAASDPKSTADALLNEQVSRAKFLEGSIPPGGLEQQRLLFEGPMTGGNFRLHLATTDTRPPELTISSLQSNHPETRLVYQAQSVPGGWEIPFTKPAYPLFVDLRLTHGAEAAGWVLKPTTKLPIPRFPANMATFPGLETQASVSVTALRGSTVSFPTLPSNWDPDQALWIYPVLSVASAESRIEESFLFLHLLDVDGNQVWAQDLPLQDISQSKTARLPFALHFHDLPAGSYNLVGGIHHPRLYRRWKLQPPGGIANRVSQPAQETQLAHPAVLSRKQDRVLLQSFTLETP